LWGDAANALATPPASAIPASSRDVDATRAALCLEESRVWMLQNARIHVESAVCIAGMAAQRRGT
jgi:hypothetical protein